GRQPAYLGQGGRRVGQPGHGAGHRAAPWFPPSGVPAVLRPAWARATWGSPPSGWPTWGRAPGWSPPRASRLREWAPWVRAPCAFGLLPYALSPSAWNST